MSKCSARNKENVPNESNKERVTSMFEFHTSTGHLWPGRGINKGKRAKNPNFLVRLPLRQVLPYILHILVILQVLLYITGTPGTPETTCCPEARTCRTAALLRRARNSSWVGKVSSVPNKLCFFRACSGFRIKHRENRKTLP